MSDKRSRRASINENPEEVEFLQLTNIAVEAIKKHPKPSFDELVALWLGEDVYQQYAVIFLTYLFVFLCKNNNKMIRIRHRSNINLSFNYFSGMETNKT